MLKVPRRKFTQEFRREAVRLVLEAGLGITEAARRLQISEKTLGNWVYAVQRLKGDVAEPVKRKSPSVNELQMRVSELEAENAQLRLEKEILKKATAFFAKESQ